MVGCWCVRMGYVVMLIAGKITKFCCWHKIGRAKEHAEALKLEIIAWHDRKPYGTVKKAEAGGSRHSIIVQIRGDCVHSLRSALDHLIYAIAVCESGINPPPNWNALQFPIGDTPAKFQGESRKIRTLSQSVRAAIEGVQPYNRRHAQIPPLLAVLRDLDNSDKHRLLHIVKQGIQRGEFIFNPPIRPRHSIAAKCSDGPIEDGAEIAPFTIDPPKFDVAYDYEITLIIALEHGIGASGKAFTDYYGLLDSLKTEVRNVVNIIGGAL